MCPHPPDPEAGHPHQPHGQTNTRENITLRQTSFAVSKYKHLLNNQLGYKQFRCHMYIFISKSNEMSNGNRDSEYTCFMGIKNLYYWLVPIHDYGIIII